MAKEKKNVEETKRYSFIQKLFYLYIIPFLFFITVLLLLLTYWGINVFEEVKQWSENYIEEKEIDTNEEMLVDDKQTGSEITEPANINSMVAELETIVQQKQREIVKLTEELEVANETIAQLSEGNEEFKQSIKEIASMYERMSTKKAAQILMELEEDMALQILVKLSLNKRSGIISQLEPEVAAKFTEKLAAIECIWKRGVIIDNTRNNRSYSRWNKTTRT